MTTRNSELLPVKTPVTVICGDNKVGGVVVGYGVSHARALQAHPRLPESVYLVELANPIDSDERMFVATVIAHPDNVIIEAECSSCGDPIEPGYEIINRDYAYDLNGDLHYTDGVNFTCSDCSK